MPREITPFKVAVRSASRKLASLTRARRPMVFPTYPERSAMIVPTRAASPDKTEYKLLQLRCKSERL